MLGRVPLFALFLKNNSTSTIPHKLRHLKGSAFQFKGSAFQFGTADAAAADGRRGSNVYEVNPWLAAWAREASHWGPVRVREKGRRDAARVNRAGSKRSYETRRRREAARRGDE